MDRRRFMIMTGAALALPVSAQAGRLDDQALRLATDRNICAVAAAVLEEGGRIRTSAASGCGQAPTVDAVFQAASLSKPVLAYIVLQMARRGEVSLDRPLSETFPDGYVHRQNLFALKAAPVVDTVPAELLRALTPRLLLTHRSGFPNWAPKGPLALEFSPGARWRYSGEGYVLLQRMIEKISGKDLQQLADKELFAPARLADTAFRLTPEIEGRLVAGQPRQLRFPHPIAASSLYTSAGDYARFMKLVLEDRQLLSLITGAPARLPEAGLSWGLGWGIEKQDGQTSIWHWGNNPGFRALAMANLDAADGIVVLTASDTGMPLAKTLLRSFQPGEHPALDLELVQ